MKRKLLMRLVVPTEPNGEWSIGKVIGMERFDLSIGPVLTILDIITGKRFKALAGFVERLVRKK